VIYAAFEAMGAVVEALEAALGPAKSTGVVWKPKSEVPVSGAEAASLIKLIDNLDDDDDVQNVFGNYAIDDAEMQRLAG
jgi:transcriptional/translational regulatory protein YebC/TACO1